ncbi:MAG TPA: S4 domain-containing protein, partial [Daejeonella sp.]|nr:S4 domain-containing protein [Daejeonella sp.]
KFYQFWLNTTDADAKSWIRIFTLKTREQIEELEREHDLAPHLRTLQKALAEEITIRSHSLEALETALKTSEFLFGNGSLEFINSLSDEEVLDVLDGLPQFEISLAEFSSGINLTDLLAEKTQVFPSKGEARKMISGGGVSVNKEKVTEPAQIFTLDNLIRGKFLVAQKGKKNYYLIIVT